MLRILDALGLGRVPGDAHARAGIGCAEVDELGRIVFRLPVTEQRVHDRAGIDRADHGAVLRRDIGDEGRGLGAAGARQFLAMIVRFARNEAVDIAHDGAGIDVVAAAGIAADHIVDGLAGVIVFRHGGGAARPAIAAATVTAPNRVACIKIIKSSLDGGPDLSDSRVRIVFRSSPKLDNWAWRSNAQGDAGRRTWRRSSKGLRGNPGAGRPLFCETARRAGPVPGRYRCRDHEDRRGPERAYRLTMSSRNFGLAHMRPCSSSSSSRKYCSRDAPVSAIPVPTAAACPTTPAFGSFESCAR